LLEVFLQLAPERIERLKPPREADGTTLGSESRKIWKAEQLASRAQRVRPAHRLAARSVTLRQPFTNSNTAA
jgi:hypothetical protein